MQRLWLGNKKEKPLLVRCPRTGPDPEAGEDSPLRCSCWWRRSWRTVSSWCFPLKKTRLCAASKNQLRGQKGTETWPVTNQRDINIASLVLGLMRTFSTGFPAPCLKAAWLCIKPYHTAKPAHKRGKLGMFLKTWSATTRLDETVFVATV